MSRMKDENFAKHWDDKAYAWKTREGAREALWRMGSNRKHFGVQEEGGWHHVVDVSGERYVHHAPEKKHKVSVVEDDIGFPDPDLAFPRTK